jgi:hypothetical protein
MNASLSFWVVLAVMTAIMWFCDHKFNMLRDASTATPRPYSYARVQLAWWTVLIFSAMISILFLRGQLPTLDNSMLVILGISAGTTTVARLIDQSDQQKAVAPLSQDSPGQNFLLDLLSDNTGVNIHRLQTLILNVSYGVWFIHTVVHNLSNDPCAGSVVKDCASHSLDLIIPSISNNDLILLGLSSGTYAALKTTENKDVKGGAGAAAQQPEFVTDEGGMRSTQAAG